MLLAVTRLYGVPSDPALREYEENEVQFSRTLKQRVPGLTEPLIAISKGRCIVFHDAEKRFVVKARCSSPLRSASTFLDLALCVVRSGHLWQRRTGEG